MAPSGRNTLPREGRRRPVFPMSLDTLACEGYLFSAMSGEETMPIKHVRREADDVDVGLETAMLLFECVGASVPADQHAERAREIYDRIRRLASQRETASGNIARGRAETVAAPFEPGESGVSPKVR